VVGVVALVTIVGAANGLVLTVPRVFYAMAKDGLFFGALARVHPRYGTPAVAIASIAGLAALFTFWGSFDQLLSYVVFTGWVFYLLGGLAVLVLRRRQPALERPFRVPGYPLTPILFVLAAVALVLNTLLTQPGRAAVGLAVVAVGVPIYLGWRRAAWSACGSLR
jgi:APA family basic amino acid/polyamine antiporter